MRLPTGSRIQLSMACAHPWTSGLRWPPGDGDTTAIDFGNAVHEAAELYILGKSVNLPEIATKHKIQEADRLRFESTAGSACDVVDEFRGAGWSLAPEVAYALNVETGQARVLTRTSHRDYSDRRDKELTCTVDIVARRNGELMVADFKSGRRVWYPGKTSAQMLFSGLCAARYAGADEVTTCLVYVDEDGRYIDQAELDSFDLDAFEDDIQQLWAKLHAGPSEPVSGAHCTSCYCPLLGHCSATRNALADVVSEHPLLAKLEAPGAAARALEALPHAEATLKAIKEKLQEMAKRSPIELGDGRVYGQVIKEVERLKTDDKTMQYLRELLGDKAAEAIEVSESASKASIERALGGKKAARNVIQQLRAFGGFKVDTYSPFQVFERKED